MSKPLPIKIKKCPIREAVIEIRFDNKVDEDAIFGLIYNLFDEKYPNREKFPILQLPLEVRLGDPNLSYNPYYKMWNENFILQIGPKIISIINKETYVGWDALFNEAKEIIDSINSKGIIKNITRLGIRYINFFENVDIYEKIKLGINSPFEREQTLIRTKIASQSEGFLSILQIINKYSIEDKEGSIIDVDTYKGNNLEHFFDEMKALLYKGHDEEKKIFFGLFKEDFLNSLEPEY